MRVKELINMTNVCAKFTISFTVEDDFAFQQIMMLRQVALLRVTVRNHRDIRICLDRVRSLSEGRASEDDDENYNDNCRSEDGANNNETNRVARKTAMLS
jgi:hypothetical protein